LLKKVAQDLWLLEDYAQCFVVVQLQESSRVDRNKQNAPRIIYMSWRHARGAAARPTFVIALTLLSSR
jgi:hypothetical protein